MANYCRHRLVIKGTPEEVERVVEEIRGRPGTPQELMDLNHIAPAPKSITRLQYFESLDALERAAESETAFEDYRRRKAAARSAAWVETGCENWGEWAQATWGSAGNVFDVEFSADEYGVIYFSSLWSPVIPALCELSRAFPTITLGLSFAEEGGYYIGKGTIKNGKKRVKGYTIRMPEGRRLFEQFWGEWFGPEGDDDKDDDGILDLSHKTAS